MLNELLIEAYHAERAQAAFYRALSIQAEQADHREDVEALSGLLADEQHHVSRLKNRMIELGVQVEEQQAHAEFTKFAEWKTAARQSEEKEIERYQRLLREDFDPETLEMLRGILETEKHHAQNLGGKYTRA